MNKIKISIKLLAIAIGLLLVLQIPTFAAKGKSTATNVRVRKTASTDSEVIELLGPDDVVEILGQEGNWYKVNFKGTIGYVSCDYISANEKVENNKPAEENNNENNEQKNENSNQNTENNEQNTENNEQKKENETQNAENNGNEASNVEDNSSNSTTPVATNKVYNMAEDSKVNILPVITSEVIGEVKKNSEVSLIINAGFWAYIQSPEISGWIRIDKLSAEAANSATVNNQTQSEETKQEEAKVEETNKEEQKSEESNQTEQKQEQQNTYTPKNMYVKVTAINVRSQSNISSDVVDSLEINAQVKVVGEENGWYKVEINGKSGYIRQDLLSNTKTEVSSRSNELDRNAANVKAEQQTAQQTTTVTTVSSEQATQAQQQTQTQQTSSASAKSSSGVTGTDIVNYAMQFKGCRYVYGAAGPNTFDCSGLTSYVYKHFGYNISRSSRDQAKDGKAVTGELQPGDILVFSNNGKTVGHVGIYIGNDKFIHASDSSTGVIVSNLSDKCNKNKYWGARRIL